MAFFFLHKRPFLNLQTLSPHQLEAMRSNLPLFLFKSRAFLERSAEVALLERIFHTSRSTTIRLHMS